MLRAIRDSDGETVEAWSQKESAGPFACPSCGGEVILRGGERRLEHFAHAAERNCRFDLGESENHRRSKAEIWLCLKDAPRVTEVQLERPLGEVRADVSARINGTPVAIEVQLSNLSVADIIRRTQEYTRRGIYVLWLARWRPALDSGRYTPKPWERWVHAAYFGRVYYWRGQTTVVPYHFDPGHVHVPARTWYDLLGKKKSARGYSRRSMRWIRPVRGQALNLLTDFNAWDRERWNGGDIEIPPSKLYCDFRAVFCQTREIVLSTGDRLHLKANRKLATGGRVTNGELISVKSVRSDGAVELADGRVLDKSFREFLPGYAVTSYGSQGKTVDHVLFSDSTIKAATNAQQWYVTISRGRRGIRIFTPDKQQLRENVLRPGHRPLAIEFATGFVPRRNNRLWNRLHGYMLRFGRRAADNFVRLTLARRHRHQIQQKYEHKITRMLGE